MCAVKANAYGHGLIPVAQAAIEGGASWLGTAQLSEALRIRQAGITVPVLAWLFTPHTSLLQACIEAEIDISAPDVWAVEMIHQAAKLAGKHARVHIEVDTGMSRGGVRVEDFAPVVQAVKQAQDAGVGSIVGLWTHLARADEPGHPSIAQQYKEFDQAHEMLVQAGVNVAYRHIANSAATLTDVPHYDLVRPGLACYGLSPLAQSPQELGLTPVMRLSAQMAMVKHIPAGAGVSYGHTFVTDKPTRIGVVPLGYGDGIPRHASNKASVLVNGQRVPIVGRVCMDQFMVDLGDVPAQAGDEVVLWGSGDEGEPTAHEWGQAIGTIDYEIVTRLGERIPREYV